MASIRKCIANGNNFININMKKMIKQTLGERVKLLRTSLKLNHQQFAADTNMTVSSLYRIENDQVVPRDKTLHDICDAYDASFDWLTDGKGNLEFSQPQRKNNVIVNAQVESWRDAAFAALKEERDRLLKDVEFYKDMIRDRSPHGNKEVFLKVIKNAAS